MFRINVVSFHMPPLRERRGDIRLLSNHFLKDYVQAFNRSEKMSFSREVNQYLLDYPWPGNIRELKHFVERAVALTEGNLIGSEVIPETELVPAQGPLLESTGGKLEGMVKRYKRQLVVQALEMTGNNKIEAARILGISRSYLFKLIKQLAINK